MATTNRCCSIVPYFLVADGKLEAFKKLCVELVEKSRLEPKCLNYGYYFDGPVAHCRESYEDAEGALFHLENVGSLLEQALSISQITRLEIHGPDTELIKLQKPLGHLNPRYFILEYGFIK